MSHRTNGQGIPHSEALYHGAQQKAVEQQDEVPNQHFRLAPWPGLDKHAFKATDSCFQCNLGNLGQVWNKDKHAFKATDSCFQCNLGKRVSKRGKP